MEISEGLLGPLLLARSTIDRSAVLRQDETWLSRAWAAETTKVILVHDGDSLVNGTELVTFTPQRAPAGDRYLLGVDSARTPYFAVRAELPDLPGTRAVGLREAGALLGDRDAGLLVYAVALEAWHAGHEYCPRCGAQTEITAAGHMRVCPRDAGQHFPRVDPAVIMAVLDDDDRILLARGPHWPEGRMSVLAGFVEPGESLEQAVIREVLEEVGIPVKAPRYLGSQPWPFPRSLMLGFFARAAATEIHRDPEEIAEAHWFSRAELRAALTGGSLRLPPPVSIARRLIETWYGDALTDPGEPSPR